MISRFPLHKRIYQHGQISAPPESNEEARGQDDGRGGDAHGARRPQSTLSSQKEGDDAAYYSTRPRQRPRPGGTTRFAKPSMHPHIFYSRLSYLPLAPTAPLCKLRGSGEGTTKDECGAAQQTATQSRRTHHITSSGPTLPTDVTDDCRRREGLPRRTDTERGRADTTGRRRTLRWSRRWPLAPREGLMRRDLCKSAPLT